MNKEKYSDPTAEQAIGNVMNEEKGREKFKIALTIKIIRLILELADLEPAEKIHLRRKRVRGEWNNDF